jgi:hypothetical protein
MKLQKFVVEKIAFEDLSSLFFFPQTRERTSFEILLLYWVLVCFSFLNLGLELLNERIIGVDGARFGTDDNGRV